jgi:hypothetical protein
MSDKYRGWTIHYDPPPIPIRNSIGPNGGGVDSGGPSAIS